MLLRKLQNEVANITKKGGYDSESIPQKFMLLIEEVGEFAKSIRKSVGTKVNTHSKQHNPNEEASDVLFLLLDICNKIGIDLEKEFPKKINKVANYKEVK